MRSIPSIVGRSLPLLLLGAGACVTTVRSREQRALQSWQRLQDSLTVQAIADVDGPRVTVRARVASEANARRVSATFTAGDDAYVLVGHLDAMGRLTILFPHSPNDDGFVRGGRSYQTPERPAGFEDEYRWRRADRLSFVSSAARLDSYDGGEGYVFIIASWRAMRLDRIASDDGWVAFHLTADQLERDPRPAIADLADVLAGDGREAYTVEYAQYFGTIPSGGFGSHAMDSRYCNGYTSGGFGSTIYGSSPSAIASPFGFGYAPFGLPGYGCGGSNYFFVYQQPFAGTTPPRPPVVAIARPSPTPPRIERPPVQAGRPAGDTMPPQRPAQLEPTKRPGIVEMMGGRRSDYGDQARSGSRHERPRNARERIDRPARPAAPRYGSPERRRPADELRPSARRPDRRAAADARDGRTRAAQPPRLSAPAKPRTSAPATSPRATPRAETSSGSRAERHPAKPRDP